MISDQPQPRAGKVPGFRITELWAFTCIEDDNTEGVVAVHSPIQGWVPLVAADRDRLESLRPKAQEIASITGKTIKLSHYSVREDVEELKP